MDGILVLRQLSMWRISIACFVVFDREMDFEVTELKDMFR